MKGLPIAAGVFALALLSYFQFPGHTWLQQDSQIYAPILQHIEDPSALRNDVLVQRPHVSFTLYDELALGLRGLTGTSLHTVLASVQVVTRGLGIWGLYLMATAAGLSAAPAMLVAAICTLGTLVAGPQVLTLEFEPIPRGFAVPLLVCGMGLAAHGRYIGAGISGAAAFLIHPPTVYPFWGLYLLLALRPSPPEVKKQRNLGLLCLFGGVLVLALAARYQAGAGESQIFFSTLTPLQAQLQQWRSAYVWVSRWGQEMAGHYTVLTLLLAASCWRIRTLLPPTLRFFVVGMPVVGLLSLPLSYLLLERLRWALLPQFQPMRALLFVVLMQQFTAAVAAIAAARKRQYAEAFAWFVAAYMAPLVPHFDAWPGPHRAAAVLLLAALATGAILLAQRTRITVLAVALSGCFLAPAVGRVVNYPNLHSAELAELSAWARASTSRDAVFLFADTPRSMETGVFRSTSQRAIYVDWKGGGQLNYLKELGEQWWFRWQQTLGAGFRPEDVGKYDALGIQYIVLQPAHRLPGKAPLFQNARYVVYPSR